MGHLLMFPGVFRGRLTKRQLAATLGYSTRWIEHRMAEGMPSHLQGVRRMYDLDEVNEWLGERAA